MPARIQPIAAKNHARQNRDAGHVRKGRSAPPQRRAFEQRACAIANPALGKEADGASSFESLDGGANSFAISMISLCRERINRAQEESHDWRSEKFGHGHPIDFS